MDYIPKSLTIILYTTFNSLVTSNSIFTGMTKTYQFKDLGAHGTLFKLVPVTTEKQLKPVSK